jgi:hypothetical protein
MMEKQLKIKEQLKITIDKYNSKLVKKLSLREMKEIP